MKLFPQPPALTNPWRVKNRYTASQPAVWGRMGGRADKNLIMNRTDKLAALQILMKR